MFSSTNIFLVSNVINPLWGHAEWQFSGASLSHTFIQGWTLPDLSSGPMTLCRSADQEPSKVLRAEGHQGLACSGFPRRPPPLSPHPLREPRAPFPVCSPALSTSHPLHPPLDPISCPASPVCSLHSLLPDLQGAQLNPSCGAHYRARDRVGAWNGHHFPRMAGRKAPGGTARTIQVLPPWSRAVRSWTTFLTSSVPVFSLVRWGYNRGQACESQHITNNQKLLL